MFSKSRTSQKGFSLIELMVVVAIIGVLAAIAVPNIQKYLAKARQTEAKTNLSSLYTSEKAFYAEYSAYHGMFEAVGYSPEGQLRYNVGFSAAVSAVAADGYNGVAGANMATLTYCGVAGAMVNGCTTLQGVNSGAPDAIAGAALAKQAFVAQARAFIFNVGTADVWQMTQEKVLSNTVNGIQ